MNDIDNPPRQNRNFWRSGHGWERHQTFSTIGYKQLLTPSREDLDLLDLISVQKWFSVNQPSVVVLAAAVGGIQATTAIQ